MHCPRCGEENEPKARFCTSCGAELRGRQAGRAEKQPARERVARLVGTTRRARLLTGGTAVAIVVAIAAFLALDTQEEEGIPRDAYTIAADEVCVESKDQIVATGKRTLRDDPGEYAQQLVPIVAEWRSEFNGLDPPPGREELAAALDSALREIEVESAALARVAREGDRDELVARAQELDQLTMQVEAAISELGLDRCAQTRIVSADPPS